MCPCNCCDQNTPTVRRFRPLAFLLQVLFAWAVLVLAGGTLKNFHHPVAAEAGRLIHTVTFVEPAIDWADRHELEAIAGGLRLVASGIPVHAGAAPPQARAGT